MSSTNLENIQQGKYIVFRDKDNVVKVKNVKTGGIELPTLNDTSGIAYAIANDTSGEGVFIAGDFSGGSRLIAGFSQIIQGPVIFGSGTYGISFSGMQQLPTMATDAEYVIWVSGSTTRAVRTADGIIEFSGGSGFAATVVQQTMDAVFSGMGGKIVMREGLYNFNLSGVLLNVNRSGRIDFGGVFDNTTISYAGAAFSGNAAITVSGTTSPNDTLYLHDLYINCGTPTSGRNAINLRINGGNYLEKIRIFNADIGIDMFDCNSTWMRDIHIRTGLIGIRTNAGPNTNANGIWMDALEISDTAQKAVELNADNGTSFVNTITNSDIETNSGAGVQIGGIATNTKIDNCYFENNQSGDVWIKGISAGSRPNATTIANCHFTNSNSPTSGIGGSIVIDFGYKTTIDTCQFYNRVSGSAILMNNASFGDDLMIINPALSAVPYLIDWVTTNMMTAAQRQHGTVIEGRRRGNIVMMGTGYVEGDVVTVLGGNNLFNSTTNSGEVGPAVVMYPAAGANKPGVIATDGISPVLTISGANRGELLQTSTTTKKAVVGSGMQPNQYIGWATEGFLSGVKINCKIL